MFLPSLPNSSLAAGQGQVAGRQRGAVPFTNLSRTANSARRSLVGCKSALGDGDYSQLQQSNFSKPSIRQGLGLADAQSFAAELNNSQFEHQGASLPHQPTAGASHTTALAEQLSWQQWLSYFEHADAAAERKEQLTVELKDAVAQENYAAASQLKAEMLVLEAQDAVAATRKQLDEALAEERYSDAATLRDVGLSGLSGWWAGQAEDDPVGHLLHITPEYSRWTGRVFRPRDIAEMKVQKSDFLSRSIVRAVTPPAKPTGSPILEVFIRPEDDAQGKYQHQAVSLRLPTTEEVEQRRRKSNTPAPPSPSIPSFNPTSSDWSDYPPPMGAHFRGSPSPRPSSNPNPLPRSFGPVVRLSVSIRHDGSASIRPLLTTQPVMSHFSAWEATEAEETLRMLRWTSPSSDSQPSSTGGTGRLPEALVVEPDEVVQMPEIPDEVIDISSQNAMSSLDGEDGSLSMGLSDLGDVEDRNHGDILGRGVYPPSLPDDDGLEEFYAELMRVSARVELRSRDQLVFHAPANPSSKAKPAGSRLGSVGPAGQVDRMGRRPSPARPPSLLQAKEPGVGEEGTSSFEVIIPMVRAAASRQASGDAGGMCMPSAPTDAVAAETLNILADQVAQSMEAKVGHAASREDIAEALREVVRRVASGEPLTSVDVLLRSKEVAAEYKPAFQVQEQEPQPVEAAAAAASTVVAETNSTFYKRIPLDHPKTDPLSGLFLGSFGPHGPELLQLERIMVDGEEMVQATKLTGDTNVPAGFVSFRAKVGRKHRLTARDVYPDDLGITARYKGEGRVAQKGFTQPRWVEGELLMFNSKGSPLAAGAELGFVWAVPGEKRFLILLHRITLSDR